MYRHLVFVIAIFLSFLMGCVNSTTQQGSARPQLKKYYTAKEYGQMTLCLGMSDTVKHVATQKLANVPKQEVRQYYSSKPLSELNLSIVDKVYSESFSDVWVYTAVTFFGECAQNMADVTPARVNLAGHCVHQSLIADYAYDFKASNSPKEKAYAYFAKLRGDAPRRIVDKVYASSDSRADMKLAVWKSCMVELSDM